MDEIWAVRWNHWPADMFWCCAFAYRKDAHDDMLKTYFPPEEYDTPRKRKNCLRRLRRMGLRIVKARLVRA